MPLIAVEVTGFAADLGGGLADVQALESAGAHAVLLSTPGLDPLVLLGATSVLTSRIRLCCAHDVAPGPALETVRALARGRLIDREEISAWPRLDAAADRAGWQRQMAESEGVDGVVVPMHDRLLDLLRNPDGEEDRTDLMLSQG